MRESKFKIEFMSEEQNEAFIVLSKEYMENLELKTNCKDTPCMFALEKLRVIKPERFASEYCLQFGAEMNGVDFSKGVKEDKMEEIRVVRKLEDLDRLENGKGLKVHWCEADKCLEIYFNSRFIDRVFSINRTDVLKVMGFKFEYKPLRSLEEVVEEMRLKSLDRFGPYEYKLFSVGSINKNSPYLAIEANGHFVGEYLFNKERAQKYADELNEIIRVGK